MTTYIVRVYRCEASRPPRMVGVVEEVEGARRHPFHDAEELWERLAELEGVGEDRVKTGEGEGPSQE
jgi:hypothetical protein